MGFGHAAFSGSSLPVVDFMNESQVLGERKRRRESCRRLGAVVFPSV